MLLSYKSSLSYYLEFSTILSASKAVIPEPKINSFINLSFLILPHTCANYGRQQIKKMNNKLTIMKNFLLLILSLTIFTTGNGQKSFGFGYKLDNNKVVVTVVFSYGPSSKAGLQKEDIIAKLNNVDFSTLDTSSVNKTFIDANDNSAFVINRNGKTLKLSITKLDRSSFLNVCLLGNCQNGKGVFVDKDGNEYNGNFSIGSKDGIGKMRFTSGGMYEGNWSMNRYNGKGKEVLKNGDSYEGNFINGYYNGEGIYTSLSGITYTGLFNKGKFDGLIKQVYNDEVTTVIYKDGVFVSSTKENKIVPQNTNPNAVYVKDQKYTDGSSYSGYVVNGMLDGYGVYNYTSGNVYEGEFIMGKKNGVGKYIYTSGDVYEGEFKMGKKNGVGKYIYKSGAMYDGHWENDKMNGFGKYDNGKKEIYEGNFKDNIKDGQGKNYTKFGNVTEENWANGKLNGKSTATIYDKEVIEYTLIQDYVDGKVTGTSKVIYPNADVYEGPWQYGSASGFGQYTYKNGDVAKGNFWSGKKMGLFEIKTKKGKQITQYFSNDTLAGTYSNAKLIYLNGDVFEGIWKEGLQDGPGKLTTKTEILTGNWVRGYLQGRVTSILKADESTTAYVYRDGIVVSESLNAKKFTAQIIKLVDNPTDEFKNIRLNENNNSYQVNEKLNGFVDCVIDYYSPRISSTGKSKWVYKAETEGITKAQALQLCKTLEDIFAKIKFNSATQKDIEYDVDTRRLINYSFKNMPPFINVDAGGDEKFWTVTIRINK